MQAVKWIQETGHLFSKRLMLIMPARAERVSLSKPAETQLPNYSEEATPSLFICVNSQQTSFIPLYHHLISLGTMPG